jgi:hypothetical protein
MVSLLAEETTMNSDTLNEISKLRWIVLREQILQTILFAENKGLNLDQDLEQSDDDFECLDEDVKTSIIAL